MEFLQEKYREEAIELIEKIEKSLLLLESDFKDLTPVEEVFRCMHNLKGNSAMFGFKMIADFTHHLESIYDLIRGDTLKISREILDLSFFALDHLSLLIHNGDDLNAEQKNQHTELSGKVLGMIHTSSGKTDELKTGDCDSIINHAGELTAYHIQFKPCLNFLLNGSNPLNLINELYQFGECEAVAYTDDIPSLEDIDADKCYTSWDIYLRTNTDINKVREVFYFAEHICELKINEVLQNPSTAVQQPVENLSAGSNAKKTEGDAAAAINEYVKSNNRKQMISSIRVPSGKLDNMMSLVSELMTLQAKLGTFTELNPQTDLLVVSENLEKISTRLRDNAFSMCLVPLENMMTPFHRLVRDLSSELNKEIEFITEGVETEIDKNIMEGLSDPLMHLLRNSIDHGIEDAATRIALGKPAHGKIIFKAYCAGTNVFIEIKDDGKGIDPEKIRQKAIEKGLIEQENNLSDKEILNLIFLPGLSTAEQVSEVSGRGVGMDVVKRKITDIRGQVKISSQINIGTTITIKLPITVSIIDGLLVKINEADFVLQLSSVERCYELPAAQQLNQFNNLIVLDGEQVPFINLVEEFDGVKSPAGCREIVIVYYDDKKIGLIVDRVVGKFQAVLKPLGRYFLHMDNISGATILGDGKIALVLDTNNVTDQFINKKMFHNVNDTRNCVLSDV
jgi:two-component system chemotaxis sensor kinase CheA